MLTSSQPVSTVPRLKCENRNGSRSVGVTALARGRARGMVTVAFRDSALALKCKDYAYGYQSLSDINLIANPICKIYTIDAVYEKPARGARAPCNCPTIAPTAILLSALNEAHWRSSTTVGTSQSASATTPGGQWPSAVLLLPPPLRPRPRNRKIGPIPG